MRSALPRPGSMLQLRELTARILSRRLDRDRPLWEFTIIDGLKMAARRAGDESRLVGGRQGEHLPQPGDVVPERVIGGVDALLGKQLGDELLA